MKPYLHSGCWIAATLILVGVSLAGLTTAWGAPPRAAGTLRVVAAENEYGDIAGQIGGSRVSVTSLLDNPNVDPHEFEASAATAKAVAGARLVIENGIGYDAWMDKLLEASPRSGRKVITVGDVLGRRAGDNPHIWYDPHGWKPIAAAILTSLTQLDPHGRPYFRAREQRFLRSLAPIYRQIAAIRKHAKGAPVTATEPVFGYMADALGFSMRNSDFQKAVMDGVDPAPRAVAQMQQDLEGRHVRVFFYNSQATEPVTSQMRTLARQHHIPIVGVTETEPRGKTFQRWQASQLAAVAHALKM